MELVSVHKDVVESGLGLENFLRGAGQVTVQLLQLVNVRHVDVELGVAVRVNVVQREGMGTQQGGAVHWKGRGARGNEGES